MKKIRIIADFDSVFSRWVEVDDSFDPSDCNIRDLFWKDSENITDREKDVILDNGTVDPWKIEDEDGNEIYAD